jgi:hypothetical protein
MPNKPRAAASERIPLDTREDIQAAVGELRQADNSEAVSDAADRLVDFVGDPELDGALTALRDCVIQAAALHHVVAQQEPFDEHGQAWLLPEFVHLRKLYASARAKVKAVLPWINAARQPSDTVQGWLDRPGAPSFATAHRAALAMAPALLDYERLGREAIDAPDTSAVPKSLVKAVRQKLAWVDPDGDWDESRVAKEIVGVQESFYWWREWWQGWPAAMPVAMRLLAQASVEAAHARNSRLRSPSGTGTERLVTDLESNSVTLDGVLFSKLDPVAVRVLHFLREQRGVPISRGAVSQQVRGCSGGEKAVRRAEAKLPPQLQSLIKGRTGSGIFLELPLRE